MRCWPCSQLSASDEREQSENVSTASPEKETQAFAGTVNGIAHPNVIKTAGAPAENGKPTTADETGDLSKWIQGHVIADADAEDSQPTYTGPAQQGNRANSVLRQGPQKHPCRPVSAI